MAESIDIIPIPTEIVHLMNEDRITTFKEVFQLDDCIIQNQNLRICGTKTTVDTAKRMSYAHFLGLKKKLFQMSSLIIQIPSKAQLTEEDIKALVGGINIEYSLTKKSVKLSGERQLLEDAKERIEHYFLAFDPVSSPCKETSHSSNRSDQSRRSSRNKMHNCWFCDKAFTSKYFRTHLVSKCVGGYAEKLSVEEKSIWLDEYYKANGDYDTLKVEYDKRFLKKRPVESSVESRHEKQVRLQENISDSGNADMADNEPTETLNPHVDNLVHNYKLYLCSRAGGRGKSDVTRKSRYNFVSRIFKKCEVETVEFLLTQKCIDKVTTYLDDMNISDATRYDYCLSIKEFLEFLLSEEEWVTGTIKENVMRNITRWDGCRASYQAGLIKQRRLFKNKEHRKMGSF